MSRPSPWLIIVLIASVAGFSFAAFSTYDFVAHLDRQVHGIHCSFLPGLDERDVTGASGCHVTLMSPYSSVMRGDVWGGIPVALPGMSVFAFLAFAATFLWLRRRQDDHASAAFLLAATLVPLLTSIGMGYLSLVTLDAACKMCIGIYVSSGVAFVAALVHYIVARRRSAEGSEGEPAPEPASMLALAAAFGIGVVFVTLPVGAYAATAPDFSRYVGACGELESLEIADSVLVPMGPQAGGVEVLEVLDPLCPACRGFERRFEAAGFAEGVSRKALLFPLDDECNWMIGSAIHPGACAISEAVLCAEEGGEDVLLWAFEQQEAIRGAGEDDPEAPARMVTERFPGVRDCVGTPAVRARLNLALRFAVDNQMPIITPQVYVGGTRLCDEDTDLGMDFAISRLLERTSAGAPRIEVVEASGLVARELAPQPTVRRPAPTPSTETETETGTETETETGTETETETETGTETETETGTETETETGTEPEPEPAPEPNMGMGMGVGLDMAPAAAPATEGEAE